MAYWSQTLPLIIALSFISEAITAQVAETSVGSQILSPYKQNLQKALLSGMSEGVVEAINVCNLEAPEIAESLSIGEIKMGRSSHRLRNPANIAPDWVEPVLNDYLADSIESSADLEPMDVSISQNRSGYVEPIVLQPLCLSCHGEEVASDVMAQIETLYPDDQATGFKTGDLRGVFWVEYPTTN